MIVVGIICLLLGWLTGIGILWWVGVIALVIGLVLMLMGAARTGGHRWY